jgi:sugar phosphate isomerase/epimerase
MSKPVVGAQLYTVRQFTKTLGEARSALEKVKRIGYTAIQVSGFGSMDPKELAKVLADSGLTVAATHVSWKRCLEDLDALIEEHRMWKCVHPAIGGLPGDYFTLDGLKKFIDELQVVVPKFRAAGMDFSYHNHNHELIRHAGRTWLDRLYAETPADLLKAEIDTHWIQAGGGDPAAWIRRCAGREPLLHLKDMIISPEKHLRFAEIGEGNLNWKEILKAAEESGVEYLLVEQDDCYGRDPFESLAISYRNLQAMGYR